MAHSQSCAHRKLEDVEAPVRVRVHLREQPIARAAAKEGHSLAVAVDAQCARSRLPYARSHLRPIALTTISTYARRFSLRSVPTHVHASGA